MHWEESGTFWSISKEEQAAWSAVVVISGTRLFWWGGHSLGEFEEKFQRTVRDSWRGGYYGLEIAVPADIEQFTHKAVHRAASRD